GGQGADTITAGDGTNVVLGDNGQVTAAGTDAPNFGGLPLTFGRVETSSPAIGGDDTISTGAGKDIVLGGTGADVIDSANGGPDAENIVLGDNGYVDWTPGEHYPIAPAPGSGDVSSKLRGDDTDPSDIDRIATTYSIYGGNDSIVTGRANDIILGGTGADTIYAGPGNDLIFGDFGRLDASSLATGIVASRLPAPGSAFTFVSTQTTAGDLGGRDVIYADSGDDIVIGGQGADVIYGGSGNNRIYADQLVQHVRAASRLRTVRLASAKKRRTAKARHRRTRVRHRAHRPKHRHRAVKVVKVSNHKPALNKNGFRARGDR
ncbi:MAG: hypothetical protein QOJ29_3231, partial [Thermoleophilaceae bacterium]|nr:hypothetical protein [Thermoleophilaceae bacterium]